MQTGPGSIDQMVEALITGSRSLKQNLEALLRRIDHLNPKVHALTEVFPVSAVDLDRIQTKAKLRSRTGREQRLLGVPIVLNCDIATEAGCTTTGSFALNFKSEKDAQVVQRVTNAGAVIIGKANITEWGSNRDAKAGHGWSAIGGQTLGVHHINQDPSGSSSGAAVAVALDLCVAAIGVETDGSIILPAERNNIVGIKPTRGLVSSDLMLTSRHFGTPGVLARTVKDAAHVLSAIAGPEVGIDDYDFASACDAGTLSNKRIGIPTAYLNTCFIANNDTGHQAILDQFEEARKTLESHVSVIESKVDLPGFNTQEDIKQTRTNARLVRICDYREDVERFLSECGEQVRDTTFEDIVTRTIKYEDEEPARGAIWLESAKDGASVHAQLDYQKTVEDLQDLGASVGINAFIERGLDAIVVPSMISSAIASYGGLPVITVPLGVYPPDTEVKTSKSGKQDLVWQGPGIPFGISFIGAAGSDHELIEMAYAFEQAMQVQRHASVLPRFAAPEEL